MILKLLKTVEQKNVNVFKIKRFKPVQNTINFLLATKFLPAQVYVFSQNYWAVDCSVNISHAVESFSYHHMIMCSKIFPNTTSALFRFQFLLATPRFFWNFESSRSDLFHKHRHRPGKIRSQSSEDDEEG